MHNLKYAILTTLTLQKLLKIYMEQLLEGEKFQKQLKKPYLHFLALKFEKCIILHISFLMSCKC